MSRMGVDPGENIRKPRLQSTPFIFALAIKAVHSCGEPPCAIRAAEQPGLPSKRGASQSPFGGIVRDAYAYAPS